MKRITRFSFTILLLLFLATSGHDVIAQNTVQIGKSYVNISKGVTGGTIEAGDILEIRATIAVGAWDNTTITRTHYIDTIPVNTTYVPGSLKILTNEGLAWRSYSDISDADQALIENVAGQNVLRINLGSSYNNGGAVNMGGAATSTVAWSAPDGGTIRSSGGRPSFYGGVAIMSASYRIQIDGSLTNGTVINTYGGAFRYLNSSSTMIETQCTDYSLVLSANQGLCSNSVGASTISDNGGTFGSGNTQNRSTPAAIIGGYVLTNVATGQPGDGTYSIINNLSPNGSININSPMPDVAPTDPAVARVHRLWDIMGDHGGTANSAAGNAPVAPGDDGGYFVAINASYANSNAIQQSVSGLCPNTYYEFSAWFKNVCKYCACDTTGTSPYNGANPNASFRGTDSSGVNPNLTFTIDGMDYYTTGNLTYSGQWVKKGFVYLTGPAQTSFTVTIRNNAAGGGGNDWAIDDVSVATCTPNIDLTPSGNAQLCYGNPVDLSSTVRSYYSNYTEWIWEKSVDGGSTWSGTGHQGIGTPSVVAGEQEYEVSYPTFLADSTTHLNIFRIRVATTGTNLGNSACSFSNSANIVVMVNNCMYVLNTDLQSFTGKNKNGYGLLDWKSTGEAAGVQFEIERSQDNINYQKIATIAGTAGEGQGGTYRFTDPLALNGTAYYRIRTTDTKNSRYSKTVLLTTQRLELSVKSVLNPFRDQLSFDIISPESAKAEIVISDNFGRMIKKLDQNIQNGLTEIKINGLNALSPGSYILMVKSGNKIISKKIIKRNE